MKAEELRIGNYFISKQDQEQYCLTYDLMHETFNKVDGLGFEDFEPITLTEECLIKLGFKKVNLARYELNKFALIIGSNELIPVIWRHENILSSEKQNTILRESIEYVHQLQNLYYTLTNEELILKQ